MLVRTRLLHACLAAGALLVTIAAASPVDASVVYSYKGNRFAEVITEGPTAPGDPYTRRDRVRGFVELDEALPADLADLTPVTPLSFRFTDGVNVLTQANVTMATMVFSTNATGDIVRWGVLVEALAPTDGGGTRQAIGTLNVPLDIVDSLMIDGGVQTLCGPASTTSECSEKGDPFFYQSAANVDAPGRWRLGGDAVPEPASMLLIGVALAGVAARRRGTRAR